MIQYKSNVRSVKPSKAARVVFRVVTRRQTFFVVSEAQALRLAENGGTVYRKAGGNWERLV